MSKFEPRNNREIVQEINTPAAPSAGARLAKGKDSSDCDDTIRPLLKSEPVRNAVEEKGAARRAVNRQIGDTAVPVHEE